MQSEDAMNLQALSLVCQTLGQEAMKLASKKQVQALNIFIKEFFPNRADKLIAIRMLTGRKIRSTNQMSDAEAGFFLERANDEDFISVLRHIREKIREQQENENKEADDPTATGQR